MTHLYEDLIVPMIRRMINLEHLKFYLTLFRPDDRCMGAGELPDHLLNHLPHLRRFTFQLKSISGECTNHSGPPSRVLVQQSFAGKQYEQPVATVHNNAGPMNRNGCRVYSLPYDFDYFFDLNHCFHGGAFHKVRLVTMYDEHPFEDALFGIVSRDMPLLEHLKISNEHGQKDKQRSSTLLVFPRLECLHLLYAHDDYAELFLSKKRSSLPRLKSLRISDGLLRKIQVGLYSDSAHIDLDGKLARGGLKHFFIE